MMWRRKHTILVFGPFSMQIGIALCTRAGAKRSRLSICSGLIGTSFEKEKNNCVAFTKVIAACEHHGIKDVMELKYEGNDEVILQFYSILYLDEKSSKLFWMRFTPLVW
jgi:hypothetical protein